MLFWIYGGGFAFGIGSPRAYDGTSLAKNQDIVVITFNHCTNVFGFPTAPDLPLTGNNLGFLDQELALNWVRDSIIHFGGNPNQVTIMVRVLFPFSLSTQSAGSASVAAAIKQGFSAGIMLSGVPVGSADVSPDFEAFDGFANALNCKQSPGPARLACLKRVLATVIRNFTNGPSSGVFGVVIDNQTLFRDSIGRILEHKTRRTPLMIGNTQNDSSLGVIGQKRPRSIPTDEPSRFCPFCRPDPAFVSLWAATARQSGFRDVYRYSYHGMKHFCTQQMEVNISSAVFPDTQLFPNAGTWHLSELELIFGTFNRTTSGSNKAVLSESFQTAVANFVKNPSQPPAPNWNQYDPNRKTLAELAFNRNIDFNKFVNL
ncbi:alpha/beta-hydrolase [Marasmius fiardii PR-910]|nr:alpha/beta-hydrolase [Marasmius fiardii PR-910]